jgi:hypothetical protein
MIVYNHASLSPQAAATMRTPASASMIHANMSEGAQTTWSVSAQLSGTDTAQLVCAHFKALLHKQNCSRSATEVEFE